MESDEKRSEIISVWINKLQKLGLIPKSFPLSSSFKTLNFIYVTVTVLSFTRYGILIFHTDSHSYNLYLGGNTYPFHVIICRTLNFGISSISMLTLGVYFIFLKRLKIIHEIIQSELLPYKSSCSSTALQNELRVRFLRRMKIVYFVTSMSFRSSLIFGTMFVAYTYTVCALKETSWTSILIWYSWAVIQTCYICFPLSNALWVAGLWYSLKIHLNFQIDQLIQMTRVVSNDDAEIKYFFNIYSDLVDKIKKFNEFSKELCFCITITNTLFSACLLCAIYIALESEPVIAIICTTYCIIFESASLALLGASSSVYERNQSLYRFLNQLYVKMLTTLSIELKHRLRTMIKDTGSKTRCPLALVNVDDRIYDRQTLARYIVYTIRTVAIVARLVNQSKD